MERRSVDKRPYGANRPYGAIRGRFNRADRLLFLGGFRADRVIIY